MTSARNFCIFVPIYLVAFSLIPMRFTKGLFIVAFVWMCGCTASQPTGPGAESTSSVLEVANVLDSAQSRFLQFVIQNGGDAKAAMQRTTDWLLLQPNIADAFTLDSSSIEIVLKSGLHSYFAFEPVDDSGYSIFRGGGGGATLQSWLHFPLATNLIGNKNILIFAAAASSLGLDGQIASIVSAINNSGLGLQVDVLRDSQCTAAIVDHSFQNYGFVILDTHGQPNSFQVGAEYTPTTLPTSEDGMKALLDAAIAPGTYEDAQAGKLYLMGKLKANPKYPHWQSFVKGGPTITAFYPAVRLELLPQWPNTLVFGNMCYSGWTLTSVIMPEIYDTIDGHNIHYLNRPVGIDDPIGKAFIDRGLISYYGYAYENFIPGMSRAVTDTFARHMESLLVGRLMNGDSTGVANLASDDKTEFFDSYERHKLYFKHYNANDYNYFKCGDTLTDPRDGQKYPTVCIGNQVWMAKNLNYNAPGSVGYNDNDANCATYGRLYDWNTIMQGASPTPADPSKVQGICPKGWHVPSASEYSHLCTFLGGGPTCAQALA